MSICFYNEAMPDHAFGKRLNRFWEDKTAAFKNTKRLGDAEKV